MLVRFYADLANVNSSGLPTASTNGIATPEGFTGARMHVLVCKSNAVNVNVYGYVPTNRAGWTRLESVYFTAYDDEAQQLVGTGGYTRIATSASSGITQQGVNTYVGFTQDDGK